MKNIVDFFKTDNTSKKEQDEIKALYRELFNSRLGREVLAHMLVELGYFNEVVESPEERAHFNYARHLLKIMGIIQPRNVVKMVDSLMMIPFAEEDEKDKNTR